MLNRYIIVFFLVFSSFIVILTASAGDADPDYRSCVKQCQGMGCIGGRCFPYCKLSSKEVIPDHSWDMLKPIYVHWKKGVCRNECQYHCMLDIEKERKLLNKGPQKYHDKWHFKRAYGIQEPASMTLSALNLLLHFHGWMTFVTLLYNKLPLRARKKPFYEYASLWHIYGILSLNVWFWSTIFHCRYCELIEKLYYSSRVISIGYSFIIAILRSFNVKDEATRVMLPAPLISFMITHIIYLNTFRVDYEWNMKVCLLMSVAQLATWVIWSGTRRHSSRWKLRLIVLIGVLAMSLNIYDFPPYKGLLDAQALKHAITLPLTYIWWGFISDDAVFLTSMNLNYAKKSK